MKRIENLGRRITCVLLVAAVGLSVAACSPQEGSNSIQEDSSFQGASEASESQEETSQGNPSSSASSLQESAPSQQEDDPSADPSSQSSAVESTPSPEPSGLAAEDFSSSEGDFTYLELEYGTPAQVVLPLFRLSGAEPDREWESNGGGFHSEYRAGVVDLDGASFGLTLGFLDGLLNSFTFTCDAAVLFRAGGGRGAGHPAVPVPDGAGRRRCPGGALLGPVPVSTFPGKTRKKHLTGGAFSLSWAGGRRALESAKPR